MWPRIVEISMGAWLMASPWIFGHTDSDSLYFRKDIACGALVVLFAAMSWWKPTSWAHYLTAGVAAWLGLWTWWFVERPGPPAAQNEITMAVFLIIMFVLPNRASEPPDAWRDYIEREKRPQPTSLRS